MLPVWAESPPPGDPTLLRLTRQLAEPWTDWAPAGVRVVTRARRDEVCKDWGHRCPSDVARVLDADRVLAFELSRKLSRLKVTLYDRSGPQDEAVTDCAWNEGRLACARGPMLDLARRFAVTPRDAAVVRATFLSKAPLMTACFTAGSGKPADSSGTPVEVRFVVEPDGRTTDVRIEPAKLQTRPELACVARVAERMRFGLATGPRTRFRFPVPRP